MNKFVAAFCGCCLAVGAHGAASNFAIPYDFPRKGVSFVSRHELNRPVTALAFDFSHGVDVRLTLRLTDARGTVFQRTFGILSGEWQHVELNVSDKGWRVNGDGAEPVFRQPAVSVEFAVEHALSDIAASVGEVRVRNLTCFDREIHVKNPFEPPLQDVACAEALVRASNAWARLQTLVPQLEKKGLGAKSRASLTVLDRFFAWIARDRAKGLLTRVQSEAREMAFLGERAVARAEAIGDGRLKDFPVPRYRGGPIERSHAQALAERAWPDGHLDRGPVFFNGFGHFQLAERDLDAFPSLGCNLLQTEIGPAWVLTSERDVCRERLDGILRVLDRAERAGVGVDVLLSPHYWPQWTFDKWPHLKSCGCYAGFCPYDPKAREVLKRYFDVVIPALKDKKALHSLCLSNEPSSGNYGKCPRLRKAWQRWLAEKYGTVEACNGALGLSLASFDAVQVPMDVWKNDVRPSPVVCAFIRFYRQQFAEWHRWMADSIHQIAPNVPVHAKIQINPTLWACHIFGSVDPVAFGRLGQYNGNDSVVFMMDSNNSFWGHNWWWMEVGYDFQRSAADIPVFNSENHIHPDRSHGTYLPGAQTYAALWQNAIHGQNASALWCWDRAYDNGKSDFNGLVLDRPECLEAYSHCALDLMRLADFLAPIQNLPPSILILYSTESILRGKGGLMMEAYRAANFTGQPLGVVSEEMLEGFGRGQESRPFDTGRVLLLPLAADRRIRPELKAGIDRFVALGGQVIETRATTERALHRRLAAEAVALGLPEYPKAVDPETGLPSFGVETRGVTCAGVSRLSLCNQSARSMRVKLARASVDLISGEAKGDAFSLRPFEVLFVEYGRSGNR